MTPHRGGRRFHTLRRLFALGTCLGPVSYVAAAGLIPRGDPLPKNAPRDPSPPVHPLPLLAVEPVTKPDFPPPRDRRIGVVGLGYYTDTVVRLCAELGLPVGFIVDDLEGAIGDPYGAARHLTRRDIPLLSTAEFADQSRAADGELLLVAGRIDCDAAVALDDDPFRQVTDWVARAAPGQEPLLHPVALLARSTPVQCPDRYAVFGFPGSGNVLTQNLVEALYARRPAEVVPAWQVRANLSEQYFYSFAARARALLAPLSPTRIEYVPHDFGTMMVSVERGDRAAVAFYVPTHRHLGKQAYPTHSLPTTQAVDFFASVNAPCVAVVRHPLETLLSQSNKIDRPSRAVLDGPLFLDRSAAQLAKWTDHLLTNRARACVVRYEDLAGRRLDELQRMAGFLGFPLTDDEAGQLYDQFLNRNLTAATSKHYYRGGSDKWRSEFTADHLRRAMRHLPAEAFTAFGYDVPTEADLTAEPVTMTPMPRSELYACLLESYPFHPVPGPHGIQVCGQDDELAAGVIAAFGDPTLLTLLAAGGFGDAPRGQLAT